MQNMALLAQIQKVTYLKSLAKLNMSKINVILTFETITLGARVTNLTHYESTIRRHKMQPNFLTLEGWEQI